MDKKRFMLLAALMITFSLQLSAQNKQVPKIYAFGFSASFNDSIVYFTDIQEIDSVWVSGKGKFLTGRDSYSYQLRNYLSEKGMPHRTGIISYEFDRKKIEKKYVKLRAKYTKNNNFDVRYLNASEFKFTHVDPVQTQELTNTDEKSAKRKEKKVKRSSSKKETKGEGKQ